MNATVTQLKTTTPKTTKSPKASKATKRIRNERIVGGYFPIAVALVALTLSLTDIAHGVQIITSAGVPVWQAWALAISFECGYVALELGTLTQQNDKRRKAAARMARPMIILMMSGSACLNALVFSWDAQGYAMQAAAIVLGIAIPAMVYTLTKFGAETLRD